MALNKQNLAITFATGIDQLTDPFQVMPTNLLSLVNCVYTKDKRLTKRNGFGDLTLLPDGVSASTLTTFKQNLTAVGDKVLAYNASSLTWVDQGRFQGALVDVLPLTRAALSQTNTDTCTANGWVISTWLEDGVQYFQVSDETTAQQLVPKTALEGNAKSARVFSVGNNFVITYLATIAATPTLRYVSLPFATLTPSSAHTISSQVKSINHAYDGVVMNDTLFIAWAGSDVGESIRVTRLSSTLTQYTTQVYTSTSIADLMSATADLVAETVWFSWYDSADDQVQTMAVNGVASVILSPTDVDNTNALTQLASFANNGVVTILGEVDNDYPSTVPSHYITKISVTEPGVIGTLATLVRSVGLASKGFVVNSIGYVLTAYQSDLQSTYFLVDESGSTIAKLAFGNGGGYISGIVLPSVTLVNEAAKLSYLRKTELQLDSQADVTYSETGVNYLSIDLNPSNLSTAEMANNLHIAGGFVWAYDGTQCTEHNFHLYPEDITATAGTVGSMPNQDYLYQVVYEWTDAQGNLHRSAPSFPVGVTLAGANDSVDLVIPTLRLTYKTDVQIVIYRWSTAQQSYHRITSPSSPLLNDPTVDTVLYTDTVTDASIATAPLIYTTGGVLENIAFPATRSLATFKNRLMVLSAEDRDVVACSKITFQDEPVQPTDLITIFVNPSSGSQQNTGPSTIISAMDDKFLIFKENNMFYIVGDGPNNLGQNNTFSEPTYIPSTVGCDNQKSLVLIPQGMMFQSNKGIWLLNRALGTQYIGADVQESGLTQITSAIAVPNSNDVRFTLSDNTALTYNYYFDRWAQFSNIPAISSCIYNDLHTYLTPSSIVRQETPGEYTDGTSPVLISFTTAWLNLAGLQGLERMYYMYLIGQYKSPHKLIVNVGYDYEDSPTQSAQATPVAYPGQWGDTPNFWGQGESWGNGQSRLQNRIFFKQQQVQAVQITVNEVYDSSYGTPPGEGLTLSGLNFIVSGKRPYPRLSSSRASS